ncbi:hypothetical protein LTS18_006455 [Coniosporium uncinatum]|uniref:Uncharacterized protein n=1 Tax=Coniosporium uncinatum TaxID=93489 RepID=A0ACC3DQ48_9PEZI|nr:hypothetical protein LTS18_006455 [Coniosporium uncinatum]
MSETGTAASINGKVQELGDVELACLICLIADQHAIVEADKESLDDLEQEIRLISSNTFGLSCAVVDCNERTTIDDLGNAILVHHSEPSYFSKPLARHFREYSSFDPDSSEDGRPSPFTATRSPGKLSSMDSRRVADVVITKNLNVTHHLVQIQALELIRGKRIFSRTAVHSAPRRFLFISLQEAGSGRLTPLLNDRLFISHTHDPEDGLPNLEDQQQAVTAEDASDTSVIHSPSVSPLHMRTSSEPLFSKRDIDTLITRADSVSLTAEIRAYIHSLPAFLRLHRAVAGGVSSNATRYLNILCRVLAPLHELTYITPSLVQLAVRKIYPHRITLTTPENERSMQWGSSVEVVRDLLEGVTVGDVIEDVLAEVEVPL